MPAGRKESRGQHSEAVRGLSLLAATSLVVGAIVLLTSQGIRTPSQSVPDGNVPRGQRIPAGTPIHEPTPAPSVPAHTSTGHEAPDVPNPMDIRQEPATSAPEHNSADAAPQTPSRPDDTRAASSMELIRGIQDNPEIALTFDAGWESKPTTQILQVLAQHGIRSTFFLTGRWIEKNKDLTRRIATEGHEIGNHTYSHRRLTGLNNAGIVEEARKTEQLVLKLTGRGTKPLLRVPYGARNRRVLDVLDGEGYRSIYWDVDSWDSYKQGITADEITKRVLGRIGNGSIVLMHCGSRATADALDDLIDKLVSAGYKPVTVSELLATKGEG